MGNWRGGLKADFSLFLNAAFDQSTKVQSIFMAVMNDIEHAQSAGNVQTRDIVDIMGHVLTHMT